MQIADGFLLRKIMDRWLVVPTGDKTLRKEGMFYLNESSALLWEAMKEGAQEDELVKILLDNYDVTEEIARADVSDFYKKLDDMGILDNSYTDPR